MSNFSSRGGYSKPPKIRVREELPSKLRRPLVDIAVRKVGSKRFRQIIESVLDPYGIDPQTPQATFVPFTFAQVDFDLIAARERIDGCPWFRVYDIVESTHRYLDRQDKADGIAVEGSPHAPGFAAEINRYFVHVGVGWQLVNGEIVMRGNEAFESTVKTAISVLTNQEKLTAAEHLGFAIGALSARPNADTSGAVAHATSAIECVLGVVTGEAMSLGKYLNKHSQLFHASLRKGLEGIYGYASDEGARHGREGTKPTEQEAEFVVAMCGAVCTLLSRKHAK